MYTSKQVKIYKQLFEAVIQENISQIRRLMRTGVSIETPSIDANKQALHIACEHKKSVAFIEELIALKANVNAKTERNFTPLHVAAQKGCEATVLTLIKAGAEIDAVSSFTPHADDNQGTTPLQEAAHQGHLGIVKILVMAGANTQYRETRFQLTAENLAHRQGTKVHQAIIVALMGYEKEFIARVRQAIDEFAVYYADPSEQIDEQWAMKNMGHPNHYLEKAYLLRIKDIPYEPVSGDDYFRNLQHSLNEGYEPLREGNIIKNFRNIIIALMKQYNADKTLALKITRELPERNSSLSIT